MQNVNISEFSIKILRQGSEANLKLDKIILQMVIIPSTPIRAVMNCLDPWLSEDETTDELIRKGLKRKNIYKIKYSTKTLIEVEND